MFELPEGIRPDIDVTWKAVCPKCDQTVAVMEPFLGDAIRLLEEHVCTVEETT